MAVSFSRPDPSSPASISSASFTPSRRGFDQAEVREFLRMVAAELARLQERERFLENELKSAQTNGLSAPGRLDEHTLIAILGEETARVLASAREASEQIRERAEESATRMVKEASQDAIRIRQAAETEAQRLREDASGDAQGEIELAKQQGREMVEEARAYREKVLAELSRRRDAARGQIEQLLQGRDRLLAMFERARSASVDVIGEFTSIDETSDNTIGGANEPAFGVTTEVAVGTPSPDHPSVSIFDHERDDAQFRPVQSRPVQSGENINSDFERSLIIDETGSHERRDVNQVTEILVHEAIDVVLTEVVAHQDGSGLLDGDAEVVGDVHVVDVADDVEQGVTADDQPESEDEFVAPVVSIFGGRRRPSVLETADVVAEPEIDEPVDEETVVDELAIDEPVVDELVADQPVVTSAGKKAIDDIFERLRASAPAKVAEETAIAQQVETSPSSPPPASPMTPSVAPTSQPIVAVTPVVEPKRFASRDTALAPLCEQISKKMKRVLADELNMILEQLNTKKPKLEIDAMVSDRSTQTARYVAAIHEETIAAASEGARSMKSARGSAKRVDPKKVEDSVGEMLADTIVSPLRARIEQLLRDCDGNTDDIADGVRAVYREWRMSRIDGHSADIACVAHSRGAFLSLKEGTEVCWMVDPNGPACADAEDNSLAGAIPCGEKFPTGHEHPLAHPGCRCLVCPMPH